MTTQGPTESVEWRRPAEPGRWRAWCRIARELSLSDAGRWLGFVGFFLNYIILKHTFFCPVTTDVGGYAVGTAMLYCYLTGRTKTLVAVLLAGAFVWPMSVYVGAL